MPDGRRCRVDAWLEAQLLGTRRTLRCAATATRAAARGAAGVASAVAVGSASRLVFHSSTEAEAIIRRQIGQRIECQLVHRPRRILVSCGRRGRGALATEHRAEPTADDAPSLSCTTRDSPCDYGRGSGGLAHTRRV